MTNQDATLPTILSPFLWFGMVIRGRNLALIKRQRDACCMAVMTWRCGVGSWFISKPDRYVAGQSPRGLAICHLIPGRRRSLPVRVRPSIPQLFQVPERETHGINEMCGEVDDEWKTWPAPVGSLYGPRTAKRFAGCVDGDDSQDAEGNGDGKAKSDAKGDDDRQATPKSAAAPKADAGSRPGSADKQMAPNQGEDMTSRGRRVPMTDEIVPASSTAGEKSDGLATAALPVAAWRTEINKVA
jgi:hypothetical protein